MRDARWSTEVTHLGKKWWGWRLKILVVGGDRLAAAAARNSMKHEAAGVASPLDVQLPSNQRPMRKDDRDEALHGGGDGGGGAARDGGHGRRSRLLYGWSGSVVAAILLVLPLTCGNYAGVMSGGYYHTVCISFRHDEIPLHQTYPCSIVVGWHATQLWFDSLLKSRVIYFLDI
jgi:hypothetical protein